MFCVVRLFKLKKKSTNSKIIQQTLPKGSVQCVSAWNQINANEVKKDLHKSE